MFGCVIDTLGYQDSFQQINETTYLLPIPDVNKINYISVFVFQPEMLAEIAAQVIIEQNGVQEPVGFLADFQPSITFVAPKINCQQGTYNQNTRSVQAGQIVIIATPLDNVIQRQQHYLTNIENQMVDFQFERMMKHFHEAMEKYCLNDNDKPYLPLSEIQYWKDRYIRYLSCK
ncbi:Conserved_hypothetical protein [Hexamita inflata]|uniref:Uncharacterized protein n=1 Tax=Hexamita inflata TaxID=28002 RepID=A0AA86PN53_9EUKA|nr:Conserved hypothetical protein [Hexamita inflata]